MKIYLSIAEAATRQGLTRDGFYFRLRHYPLEPDAMIGKARGWLPQTIDAYAATIPNPGPIARRAHQETSPDD